MVDLLTKLFKYISPGLPSYIVRKQIVWYKKRVHQVGFGESHAEEHDGIQTHRIMYNRCMYVVQSDIEVFGDGIVIITKSLSRFDRVMSKKVK